MSQTDDDTERLANKAAFRKRSSILKPAKSPNRSALKDLDLNFHSEEKKSVRYARRVSFADKYQIKEFHTDSVTFSWNTTTQLKPITGSDESSSASSSENSNFKSQIQGFDSLLCGKIQNETEILPDEEFFPVENTAETTTTRQKRILVVQSTQTTHKRQRLDDEIDTDEVFTIPEDHNHPCRKISTSKIFDCADKQDKCDSTNDMSFTEAFGVIHSVEKFSTDFILSAWTDENETSAREGRKKVRKPPENETDKENDCTANIADEDTTEISHDGNKNNQSSNDEIGMEMTECLTGNIEVNQMKLNDSSCVNEEKENKSAILQSPRKIQVKSENEGGQNSSQIQEKIGIPCNRRSLACDDMEMTEVNTGYIEIELPPDNIKGENGDEQNLSISQTKVCRRNGTRRSIAVDDMEMTEVDTGYIEINSPPCKTNSETEEHNLTHVPVNVSSADDSKNISFDSMEMTEVNSACIEINNVDKNGTTNQTILCDDEMKMTDVIQEDILENVSLNKSKSACSTQNVSSLSLTYEFTGQITRESTAQLLKETERMLNQVDDMRNKSEAVSKNITFDVKDDTDVFQEQNEIKFPTTDELLTNVLTKLNRERRNVIEDTSIDTRLTNLFNDLSQKTTDEKSVEQSCHLDSADTQEEMIFDEQCPVLHDTPTFDESNTDLLLQKNKTCDASHSFIHLSINSVETSRREETSKSTINFKKPDQTAVADFKMPVTKSKKKTVNESFSVKVSSTPRQVPPSTPRMEAILITPRQKTNILQTNSLLKNVRHSSQKRINSSALKRGEKTLLGHEIFTPVSEGFEDGRRNVDDHHDANVVKQTLQFAEETEIDQLEKLNERTQKIPQLTDLKEDENESRDIEAEDLFSFSRAADSMLESANRAAAVLDELLEKFSIIEDLERLENLNARIAEKEQHLNEKNAKVEAEKKSFDALQQELTRVSCECDAVKEKKAEEEKNIVDLETETCRLQEKAVVTWKFLEGHPEKCTENGVCLSYLWRSLFLEVVYGDPIPSPPCFSTLPAFNITSIKLVPRVDPPNPLARLTHWLVIEGLKENNFLEMSPNTFELHKVLNAVSTVVGFTRWLVEDVKKIETNHELNINHNKIAIKFNGAKLKAIFDLSFTIQLNSYPLHPLKPDFLRFIGDVTEESILSVVASVQPGAHYLQKVVKAVDSYLL